MRRMILGLIVLATTTLSCSDSTGVTTGLIEVVVATSGADMDSNGYSLMLDGLSSRGVGVAELAIYRSVDVDRHLVRLEGLAPRLERGSSLLQG